jgi:GntR family transcriptional regulator of abcA and norABC
VKDSTLVEKCVTNKVLVYPGTVYGATSDQIRLVFARASEDEIEEGIKRLAASLQ